MIQRRQFLLSVIISGLNVEVTFCSVIFRQRHTVAYLFEVLSYKPEDRGFGWLSASRVGHVTPGEEPSSPIV
jgi:hypothetical protein